MFVDAAGDTVAWSCIGASDRRMRVHNRLENTVRMSDGGES